MSQQLGIILMIDNAAAIEAGNLDGSIYLVDNAKWAGSVGEGTGHLVTAVCGSAFSSPPVLNWISFGIASPPPTLPQSFFLDGNIMENRSQGPHAEGSLDGNAGAWAKLAVEPSLLRHPPRKVLDILGNKMALTTVKASAENEKATNERTYYPNPVISNITGEAVDLRVIYPAQYGSPDLFYDGLYWSATVDTNKVGRFAYTLHITLLYSERVHGDWTIRSVTLPYVSYINVTNVLAPNGFLQGTINPADQN